MPCVPLYANVILYLELDLHLAQKGGKMKQTSEINLNVLKSSKHGDFEELRQSKILNIP